MLLLVKHEDGSIFSLFMYLESACGVWRAGLARLEQVVVTDQVGHRRESRQGTRRVVTGRHRHTVEPGL